VAENGTLHIVDFRREAAGSAPPIEETLAAVFQRCKQHANQAAIDQAVAAERAWFVQALREWDSTSDVESVLRIRLEGMIDHDGTPLDGSNPNPPECDPRA
jgi:hypothetical protein